MKRVLLISILFASLSSVQAQKSNFKFGLAAGINVANITDHSESASVSFSSRIGFKGNLFFELPVSKNFSIQPELGYDGLGFKVDAGSLGLGGGEFTSSLNYLTFSLLPKIDVNQTGLSFFAGPSVGLLLSSRATDNMGNSGNSDGDFNSIDVFGVVGAEYFFPTGVGFSVRYMGGLTNIAKDTQDGESVHNHAWSFMIAYKIK